MEDIIKAVGKSEYDTAAMLILLDHLEQNDLEKLLYFFVYKLINEKITEPIFIEMIDHINRTKIDFCELKHIKQITELLVDENYSISSELLTLLCDLKNLNNELSKFINVILKSEGSLNYKIKNVTQNDNIDNKIYSLDIVIKLYNIINETEKYIRSFGKLALSAHPSNYPGKNSRFLTDVEGELRNENTKSKYTRHFIIEQFESYCRDEIVNRLILLKNNFGIYYLANIGVSIITINNFNEMNYNEAVKYYYECIKKIKRNISNHLRLFKNYIRLYDHYNNLVSNETQLNSSLLINGKEAKELDDKYMKTDIPSKHEGFTLQSPVLDTNILNSD